jgi:hypothetical protein
MEALDEPCCYSFNVWHPVVYGSVERARVAADPVLGGLKAAINGQTMAYLRCVIKVERWLVHRTASSEVAVIVMENNDQARQSIKTGQMLLRHPRSVRLIVQYWSELVLTKIVDTVHFGSRPAYQGPPHGTSALRLILLKKGSRWRSLVADRDCWRRH